MRKIYIPIIIIGIIYMEWITPLITILWLEALQLAYD